MKKSNLFFIFVLLFTMFILLSCDDETTAFEQECTVNSQCEEDLCLVFNTANQQGKDGICSKLCYANGDCGDGATCYAGIISGYNVCLADCEKDSDCDNGFICFDGGDGNKACFVSGF